MLLDVGWCTPYIEAGDARLHAGCCLLPRLVVIKLSFWSPMTNASARYYARPRPVARLFKTFLRVTACVG